MNFHLSDGFEKKSVKPCSSLNVSVWLSISFHLMEKHKFSLFLGKLPRLRDFSFSEIINEWVDFVFELWRKRWKDSFWVSFEIRWRLNEYLNLALRTLHFKKNIIWQMRSVSILRALKSLKFPQKIYTWKCFTQNWMSSHTSKL